MSKHINLYSTEGAFAAALANGINTPNLSYVTETGETYTIPSNAWGVCLPSDGSTDFSFRGSSDAWRNYKSKIGRYLMYEDGRASKLHPSDSTKLLDGTVFDASSGNVMVRVPRLYYLSVTDTSNRTVLWMSEEPFSDRSIGESWIGAYLGCLSGGKLRSQRGSNPTRSRTISQFWTDAQGNGRNWGLSDYNHRRLMMMLFVSEYLSYNSQAKLGNGMTGDSGNWTTEVQNAVTGATYSLGDACGKVNYTTTGTNACHVSLFGIEDPYGWFWEMIQGVYFGASGNAAQNGTEMFIYEGNRMPSSSELTTYPNGNYRQMTRVTSSGWAKLLMGGSEFDVMPKALGGGSASYLCDYYYANNTGQLLLWGGHAYYGSYCGLAYSDSSGVWSVSYSSLAARLAYYGGVKLI